MNTSIGRALLYAKLFGGCCRWKKSWGHCRYVTKFPGFLGSYQQIVEARLQEYRLINEHDKGLSFGGISCIHCTLVLPGEILQ